MSRINHYGNPKCIKDPLSGLKQFLANKISFRKMKLMVFLFFKYQIFCPELFGYAQNQLYEKAKVNSKIYSWKTNNYMKHITQCRKR